MKKQLLLCMALVCALLVGCQQEAPTQQIYSFSGEDDHFALTNGVIVLSDDSAVIYGGLLSEKGTPITNIVYEETELSVSWDGGAECLTSFVSIEQNGDGFGISDPGSSSGAIPVQAIPHLADSLYYTITLETADGADIVSEIKLDVVDVSGLFGEG